VGKAWLFFLTTGASGIEEDNYFSKVALLDGEAPFRGSVPLTTKMADLVEEAGRQKVVETDQGRYTQGAYETWGAAGLTGVWADMNSRDSIYAALRRKETFATSGPRIQLRFFAATAEQAENLRSDSAVEAAYRVGVPMGSNLLIAENNTPAFLLWALRDAQSAPLQRLQIVKGWLKDGEPQEQVFDVACSAGEEVNPETHRCPNNNATVDLNDCSYSESAGAGELRTIWEDPTYDAEKGAAAFYYARVLENPTCRWSTWDAIRAGVEPREGLNATIQERAWSSPIWVRREH
jgi:hypothetical protein